MKTTRRGFVKTVGLGTAAAGTLRLSPGPFVSAADIRAAAAVASGGTLIVVGHDRDNLTRGYGGPSNPELLYTSDLLRDNCGSLQVERVEQVERTVDTDDGARNAVDTLLRAVRPA